jgi:outer membrane receptor for monomeric catechols
VYDSGLPTSLLNTGNNNSKGGSFATFANTQVGLFNDYAIVTGGVRRDQNKAGWTKNNLNNTRANTPTTPVITSPLVGLTLKPAAWIALFAVYSDAGAAAATVSTYGGLPVTDPRQILVSVTPDTTNKEFGAKFTFFKGRFSLGVSHFDTLQSGITRNQTDPSYPGGSRNFIDSGNRSRGVDVSWAGDLTANLSVFGGYVFDETSAPGTKPNGANSSCAAPRETRSRCSRGISLRKRRTADLRSRLVWFPKPPCMAGHPIPTRFQGRRATTSG